MSGFWIFFIGLILCFIGFGGILADYSNWYMGKPYIFNIICFFIGVLLIAIGGKLIMNEMKNDTNEEKNS